MSRKNNSIFLLNDFSPSFCYNSSQCSPVARQVCRSVMEEVCQPTDTPTQPLSRSKRSPFFGHLIEAKKNFLSLLFGKFTGGRQRPRRPRRPRYRQRSRSRPRPSSQVLSSSNLQKQTPVRQPYRPPQPQVSTLSSPTDDDINPNARTSLEPTLSQTLQSCHRVKAQNQIPHHKS